MKILFLSIAFPNFPDTNLYSDLVDSLTDRGHDVTVVSSGKKNVMLDEESFRHLVISVPNLFDANKFKKGIANLRVNNFFYRSIMRNLDKDSFDLIMYATPPVTLATTIKRLKKYYCAKTFLMLKDIFPQNAVDLGMFSKKSPIYQYFRTKELNLYTISDIIGCMSEANIQYLNNSTNNKFSEKVKLFPNTISDKPLLKLNKIQISNQRARFGLPNDKIIFMFGGNLGRPQGIDDLLNNIKLVEDITNAHFVIVGSGTEVDKVSKAANVLSNLTFISRLSSQSFNTLLSASDVGIISLNKRFTIPNYPSRTLSYLRAGIPILATTDKITDIKELVENTNSGKWSYSEDYNNFKDNVRWFIENQSNLRHIGDSGRSYFKQYLLVGNSVDKIEEFFEGKIKNGK